MNNQELFKFLSAYKISKNEFVHKNDIPMMVK